MPPNPCPQQDPRTYVALLRGINVGGRRKIKMADLRAAFADLGYANVKTVLASGNVLFDAADQECPTLARTLEQGLRPTLGDGLRILVRTIAEMADLLAADPFRDVPAGAQTKFYVTFLPVPARPAPPQPDERSASAAAFVGSAKREVFSAIDVSRGRGSIDLIAQIEQQYGKVVTTRTWQTVARIVAAAS